MFDGMFDALAFGRRFEVEEKKWIEVKSLPYPGLVMAVEEEGDFPSAVFVVVSDREAYDIECKRLRAEADERKAKGSSKPN